MGLDTHFDGPRASLDLTHVMYDDDSFFAFALALVTLSPILLMASYAALAFQSREYLILVMWVGQTFGEGLNLVIKSIIKEPRPNQGLADGYGFPSSHSQYMGYFTTFLICHLWFRHRFASTGSIVIDRVWRSTVYLALSAWAGLVAYSRYYLGYHSPRQIAWGLAIGSLLAIVVYSLCELVPARYPNSMLGQFKTWILSNPVSTFLQLRDGWAIWADAGRESEWLRWREAWDKKRRIQAADKDK
ncbi:phosphatidic acid phosphatase type 2/haloperoxidase [Coprinopsis sp. MPI-PUGE-AT-0042]|nr:phosphatidic acid phosphatase type 2/haloperoxidase [Coprinopsis sp. MPI-PUGE-AT-0042]